MKRPATALSESEEDYLEAIGELMAVEGHAHTKKIAARLGVKMPSVTLALRRLAKAGFITYSTNQPVELTESGMAIARRVMNRHHTLAAFFEEVLGISHEKAERAACHLEHAVDDDTVRRFAALNRKLATASQAGEK
ncbi:MAG: metal-dependent transcriptional regulator [Kiritimatiellae bacterium]|nr:metal-dependent transcriptional regulator [Kiritimatiellia bacterium]MBQ9344259.1 metal-dependent transcriptional regulator [Kiritimatiellia bacterium]